VVWMEKTEHQRNANRLYPKRLQFADQRRDLIFVKRGNHLAVSTHAFGNLEASPAGNETRRSILKHIVKLSARRAAQLQHIAKAARGKGRGAGAGLLEDGSWHPRC